MQVLCFQSVLRCTSTHPAPPYLGRALGHRERPPAKVGRDGLCRVGVPQLGVLVIGHQGAVALVARAGRGGGHKGGHGGHQQQDEREGVAADAVRLGLPGRVGEECRAEEVRREGVSRRTVRPWLAPSAQFVSAPPSRSPCSSLPLPLFGPLFFLISRRTCSMAMVSFSRISPSFSPPEAVGKPPAPRSTLRRDRESTAARPC